MSESLTRLQQIRTTADQLRECQKAIVNPAKKREIEKLLQELRVLEEALLVRAPLPQLTAFAPVRAAPALPSISNFRVFADQNKLYQLDQIQQRAVEQFPTHMVPQAVQSVVAMNQAKDRSLIEAQAAHMSNEIRAQLYGKQLSSPVQLRQEVHRIVSNEPAVQTSNIDLITDLVTKNLSMSLQTL